MGKHRRICLKIVLEHCLIAVGAQSCKGSAIRDSKLRITLA